MNRKKKKNYLAEVINQVNIQTAASATEEKEKFEQKWKERALKIETDIKQDEEKIQNDYLAQWDALEKSKEDKLKSLVEENLSKGRSSVLGISKAFDDIIDEVKQISNDNQSTIQSQIQQADEHFKTFEKIYSQRVNLIRKSRELARVNYLYYNLLFQLKNEKPYLEELSQINENGSLDGEVTQCLNKIKPMANTGVKSIDSLQQDFVKIHQNNYITLSAKENTFFGMIKAYLYYIFPLKVESIEGLVPGDDTPSIMSRARYHLNKGSLPKTVSEVKRLQQPTVLLFQYWIEEANRKIEIDKQIPHFEKHIQTKLQQQINEHNQL